MVRSHRPPDSGSVIRGTGFLNPDLPGGAQTYRFAGKEGAGNAGPVSAQSRVFHLETVARAQTGQNRRLEIGDTALDRKAR